MEYSHWIIGLGDSGQKVIEEISDQEISRNMNLIVIRVDEGYPTLPKGSRVDYDNFIVLSHRCESRSDAREALLRDIRKKRPILIKRMRTMLEAKKDRQNVVWLVGSIYEAQTTGLIFDLAHVLKRIGNTPGHDITHIFWMLSMANGASADDIHAAAVLQEIHHLTQVGDVWKRYFPYESGEKDESLMSHIEDKPDQDIDDLILCRSPDDQFGYGAEDELFKRMAFALIELTQSNTFSACANIWRNHIMLRRQRIVENNDLYLTALGTYVVNIPKELLRDEIATEITRQLLVGDSNHLGIFDVVKTNNITSPAVFLSRNTQHNYLREIATMMRGGKSPNPENFEMGAVTDLVTALTAFLNRNFASSSSSQETLGRNQAFLDKFRQEIRKLELKSKPVRKAILGAWEVVENLSELKSYLGRFASTERKSTDDHLASALGDPFHGSPWPTDQIRGSLDLDNLLTKAQRDDLESGFSFKWKIEGDRIVLNLRISGTDVLCNPRHYKNIWEETNRRVSKYISNWDITLDDLPKISPDKIPKTLQQIDPGSLMLHYDRDLSEGVDPRVILIGGTDEWQHKWGTILNADSGDWINGPANRGVILMLHSLVPLRSVTGFDKVMENYMAKPELALANHVFESEQQLAMLKVRAHKYASRISMKAEEIKRSAFSIRALSIFDGIESENIVKDAIWFARTWLRGLVNQVNGHYQFKECKHQLEGNFPFEGLQAWLALSEIERASMKTDIDIQTHPVLNERVTLATNKLSGNQDDVDWGILVFAALDSEEYVNNDVQGSNEL